MAASMKWQPGRLTTACLAANAVPELIARATKIVVRIRPYDKRCKECGGKTYLLHHDDALVIDPNMPANCDVYACEKDVLTD